MSSLRNSLHRRNHKERSQLAHRSRLGILEKHKDYVQRARNFHSKQDRIKRLREKAAERNKDEFYFGMIRSKTKEGVHIKDRGNVALPTDMVKVLKSQDGNYIRAVRQAGLKKIDKLKLQLSALADLTTPGNVGIDELVGDDDEGLLDEESLNVLRDAGILHPPKSGGRETSNAAPKHILFFSNEDEVSKYRPPQAGSSKQSSRENSDHDSLVDLGWEWPESKASEKKINSSSNVQVRAEQNGELNSVDLREEALTHRRQLLMELAARIKRDINLRYAGRELEMQRLMMGKGAARKIRGIEKDAEEGVDDDDDDDDKLHARKGKPRGFDSGVGERQYKPRVYKWRGERKK